MEILALIIAIFAVAYAFSLKGDIEKLEQKELMHRDQFDRAIRQLQDVSLNDTDRETLDRLNEAAWKAKHYDPHRP